MEFPRVLGEWSTRPGPLYRRLADALRAGIERGEIARGERLPPERTLAQLLSVSRSTVVAAYDRLREEDWLQSRQGSGTYVGHRERSIGLADDRTAPVVESAVFVGLNEETPSTMEFTLAALPGADVISAETMTAAAEDLREVVRTHGYFPYGLPALRDAIADLLTRASLPTRQSQVLVTCGAQQAISLSAALFVRPGDPIVIENPTYAGAMDAFRGSGATLIPIAVDAEGARVDLLRDVVLRHAPRAAYLCPTFHSPTGALLSELRRRELARIVEDLGLPVVEDNTLADLAIGARPPAPVAAFTKAGPVLTIGSLSKVFWGGLRVGWIRGPEAMIDRLVRLKVMMDYATSLASQVLALRLLAHIDEARAVRQAQAAERLDLMRSLFAELLPAWSPNRPDGGFVLWVRLPRGDADEFSQVALRHGVAVVPGSVASPDHTMREYLRIPFVGEPEFLTEGVHRMARAWDAYLGSLSTRESVRAIV
jgi:DNA-binding transcriptional MocR family regulator